MGASHSDLCKVYDRHVVVHAAVPDGPADPAQDSSVVTTHTTKSTTTYISPEPQYVKAEGPLPWIMHKLVVGGTITLAWLLLSSTAALAGEVKHLSCASGRKSSPGSSAGSCQTSKLKAEIKELKRENAKLQAEGGRKHIKAFKHAISSLRKGDRTLCLEADLLRMSNNRLQKRVKVLRSSADEEARKRDDMEAHWMQTFENVYLKRSHGLQDSTTI